MARKSVNPFAVCKAAQKRHGFGKKKLERCIRSVKKGMGHITSIENSKAMSALSEGVQFCASRTMGTDDCERAVIVIAKGLEKRGFMVGSYSRDY